MLHGYYHYYPYTMYCVWEDHHIQCVDVPAQLYMKTLYILSFYIFSAVQNWKYNTAKSLQRKVLYSSSSYSVY